jgi:hypothetical protein
MSMLYLGTAVKMLEGLIEGMLTDVVKLELCSDECVHFGVLCIYCKTYHIYSDVIIP